MVTVITIAREDQTDAPPESARHCIVTGAVRPKEELIRFVVSPDNIIVPDLAQNLPGRGFWVTAERTAIETAIRKNLFSKAAKTTVTADADLASAVAQLLKKRCLDWIGLARRAGIAVLGQPQVEAALKSGTLALLLIADDAATNGLEKIRQASVETVPYFSRNELGMALGYEQIVYAGLKSHGLTEKLRFMLAQLEKFGGAHHVSREMDSGIK